MAACQLCIIATVCILLGIGIASLLSKYTSQEIIHRFTLTNESTLFKSWSSAPTSSLMCFYFFVVSNVKQFAEGEIPILTLRGPYTYAQVTTKENFTFNTAEGTIQFTQKDKYIFMPELSNGTKSDIVTVVNLAYLALADKVSKYPELLGWILELLEMHYGNGLFLNRTVDQLIWGYEDPVLKQISKLIPVSPIVGIISNGNNSFGENFTIHDGVSDIDNLGKVVSYNGEASLHIWGTEQANQINGSDGSLFPPFRRKGLTQYVFAGDICRSLEFESKGIDFIHGVPTLKFQLSDRVLLSPDVNPANRGFCLDYPNCLKSGVLDMRTCRPNTPTVVSLPHFNQADQSYRDGVVGVAPTEDMTIKPHVEPQTGVVLQAQKMIQINAVIRRDKRFRWLAKVRDTILPVVYLNRTTTVSEEVSMRLKKSLLWPQLVVNTLSAVLILGGSVGLLISAYQASRLRRLSRFKLADGENDPLL